MKSSEHISRFTKYVNNNEKLYLESTNSQLLCSSIEHINDAYLREGNKVFAIIEEQNNEYKIQEIICWDCSIQPVVDKIKTDNNLFIIEGLLNSELTTENTFQKYITNIELWEIL